MNSINVIAPYKWHGMWVFDDERVGLDKEPFVAGADTMIDRVVTNIPNALSLSQTLSGWRLIENQAILVRDRGIFADLLVGWSPICFDHGQHWKRDSGVATTGVLSENAIRCRFAL